LDPQTPKGCLIVGPSEFKLLGLITVKAINVCLSIAQGISTVALIE
jgi:hypothetical protein